MPPRRRERPVTNYEEYLRRYLPRDAADEKRNLTASPEEAGEDRAKQAVERAVAQLTGSEP